MAPSIRELAVLSSSLLIILPATADPITAAPNLHPVVARQGTAGSPSCNAFYSVVGVCTAATSNLLDLPFTVEASCLCYSSSIWQPSIYDNALAICLSYYA